jgi:OHCU decarboxylase
VTAGLARINTMSSEEATANLLECCSSENWARQMAELRPFQSEEQLLDAADRVWRRLSQADWLEAFRHHPQIGEKTGEKVGEKTADKTQTRAAAHTHPDKALQWAKDEQSATRSANQQTLDELATANRDYLARFGYISIICATGKSAEEMLALLRQRLQNDPVKEIGVAAEEQSRITRLRLVKLLQGK